MKKLSAQSKVDRIKVLLARALYARKYGEGKDGSKESLNTLLCKAYAVLEADKDDEFLITRIWLELQNDIEGVTKTQLTLPTADELEEMERVQKFGSAKK